MYTNPSNIVKTLIKMLESNADSINRVVQIYEPNKGLTVLEGMRRTLPVDAFPCLEIEPTSGANEWAATRTQRPRYSFQCTLTARNDNEAFGVEYIATIVTILTELMTDPMNLQMRVVNESKWDPNSGLVATYIMDSLVESVTYNANKEGTIRTAEFDWFALINEPFPDSKFAYGGGNVEISGSLVQPVIVRPLSQ